MLSPVVVTLLETGLKTGASDWHLDAGKSPAWRVEGDLTILRDLPSLNEADILGVVAASNLAAADNSDSTFRHAGELFRVSSARTREGLGVVLRHVPASVPSLRELQVPERFLKLLDAREGLILVTGPTGSGKSTTLNAAVAYLNGQREGGTITILGDPIEYFHEEQYCRIRHREFGRDFPSWSATLASTLRQDPDVICISELRDADTVAMALAAADTGHLVLATLHNGCARDAIGRILDTCHESDREQQRAMVAKALRAVLAQQLLPGVEGRRVAAFELLVNTEGVSNLIRERRFRQIDDEILRGRQHGMVTMDASILALAQARRVTPGTAIRFALNPTVLEKQLSHL